MARQVWPAADVIAASREAVFLALYRYAREQDSADVAAAGRKAGKGSGGTDPSEWAIRLDVMAYPQTRLLDGWARPLPSAERYGFVRTREEVLAAVSAGRKEIGKTPGQPLVTPPPAAVLARLPAAERKAAASPEAWVRARLWRQALAQETWPAAQLAALWAAEPDPVVRLAVLERLDAQTEARVVSTLVGDALDGPNDYVRRGAIDACTRIGGAAGAAGLLATLERARSGRHHWKNPNNVLCDATAAVAKVPDVRFIPLLADVLAKESANNSATFLAVEALAAIGRAHGMEKVREPLERARTLEGPLQERIRKAVAAALGE